MAAEGTVELLPLALLHVTRNDVILSLMRAGLYRGSWDMDDDTYEAVSSDFIERAAMEFPNFLPPELRGTLDVGGGKSVAVAEWLPEATGA